MLTGLCKTIHYTSRYISCIVYRYTVYIAIPQSDVSPPLWCDVTSRNSVVTSVISAQWFITLLVNQWFICSMHVQRRPNPSQGPSRLQLHLNAAVGHVQYPPESPGTSIHVLYIPPRAISTTPLSMAVPAWTKPPDSMGKTTCVGVKTLGRRYKYPLMQREIAVSFLDTKMPKYHYHMISTQSRYVISRTHIFQTCLARAAKTRSRNRPYVRAPPRATLCTA